MAKHLLNDLFTAQRVHWRAFDKSPITQYRHAIADGFQLVNAMRDEDHGDAVTLQPPDHVEQVLAFILIQRGGRLIEDQKAAVMRKRARQQDLLLFGQRTLFDAFTGVDIDFQQRQRFESLFMYLRPVVEVACFRERIEHDVFRHAQAWDQRHIHFLLDEVNAELFRITRRTNFHLLAINLDLPLIMVVRA